MRNYLGECPCGSGKEAEAQFDARDIFLNYTCSVCHKEKMSKYRPDVLENPNYDCDETIESE
jgi:hypothetical protein